jgi:hypothetical protein
MEGRSLTNYLPELAQTRILLIPAFQIARITGVSWCPAHNVFLFFALLEFELRAYTLSHSTSLFL